MIQSEHVSSATDANDDMKPGSYVSQEEDQDERLDESSTPPDNVGPLCENPGTGECCDPAESERGTESGVAIDLRHGTAQEQGQSDCGELLKVEWENIEAEVKKMLRTSVLLLRKKIKLAIYEPTMK